MEKTFWESVNNRVFSNPVYFIFILSVLLVHWRFFVILFFVSNESIVANYHVAKDVYLKHVFFDPNHLFISTVVFSLPFFITLLILYILQPKVLPMLLRKHKEYEDARLEIEAGVVKKEKAVITAKEQNEKEKERLLKLREINETKEFKLNDQTVLWEKEYENEFRRSRFFREFKFIVESIYERNGVILVNNKFIPSEADFRIPKELLAYAHTNGLVSIVNNGNNIDLTEKGKFFVKKFSLNRF